MHHNGLHLVYYEWLHRWWILWELYLTHINAPNVLQAMIRHKQGAVLLYINMIPRFSLPEEMLIVHTYLLNISIAHERNQTSCHIDKKFSKLEQYVTFFNESIKKKYTIDTLCWFLGIVAIANLLSVLFYLFFFW